MLAYRRLWNRPQVLLRFKTTVADSTKLDLSLALEQTEKFDTREAISNDEVAPPGKKFKKDYTVDINQNILSKDMRWAIQKTNRDRKVESEKKITEGGVEVGTVETMGRKKPKYTKEEKIAYQKKQADQRAKKYVDNQHKDKNKSNAVGRFRSETDGISLSERSPELMNKLGIQDTEPNTGSKDMKVVLTNEENKIHIENFEKILDSVNKNLDKSPARENNDRDIKPRHRKLGIFRKNARAKNDENPTEVRHRHRRFDIFRKEPRTKNDVDPTEVKFSEHSATPSQSGSIFVSQEVFEQSAPLDKDNIPRLAHQLDRTLFSPGVHFLQDPRTRVYNFPPVLKKVIKYDDFNFDAIPSFTKVSKDEVLLQAAIDNDRQFYSSTSSMTVSLIQFYFLLNNYDRWNKLRFNFTPITGFISTTPASMIIQPRGKNPKSGKTIYSIESDSSYDNEILLSAMGHCLEAFLTNDELDFRKYNLKFNQNVTKPVENNIYNYATYGEFLMRSQLDCYDERLPGNGTFDLKTRAVCSIRYDSSNPDAQNNQYQIWKLNGYYESFDREFQDLIKTGALLKYMFQARIGQMDGIFVAYHNINSIFGFQYLPLEELDNIFYNHKELDDLKTSMIDEQQDVVDISDVNDKLPSFIGETQFKQSLKIWEVLMKRIIEDIESKDQAFRLIMKTKSFDENTKSRLYIFAVPISDSQIEKLKEFPTKFETSFKYDIPNEQRLENLKSHQNELTEFNESMVEGSLAKNIMGYYLDINEQQIGDAKFSQKGTPYPKNDVDDWSLKYKIHKYKNKTAIDEIVMRDLLFAMMQPPTDSITALFEKNMNKEQSGAPDTLKLYEKIGKARAEAWSDKDENPVIYEPKN